MEVEVEVESPGDLQTQASHIEGPTTGACFALQQPWDSQNNAIHSAMLLKLRQGGQGLPLEYHQSCTVQHSTAVLEHAARAHGRTHFQIVDIVAMGQGWSDQDQDQAPGTRH